MESIFFIRLNFKPPKHKVHGRPCIYILAEPDLKIFNKYTRVLGYQSFLCILTVLLGGVKKSDPAGSILEPPNNSRILSKDFE